MSLRTRFTLGLVATAVVASTAGLAAASSPVEVAARAPGEYAAGRVLVKYAPGVDHAAQAALEHGLAARELSTIDALGVRVLQVPVGAEARVVQALSRSRKVAYAERDALGHVAGSVNDPYFPQQWGLATVEAPTAWDTTSGSSSTVIAVLDTGVDTSHPDLAGRLVAGYDFVNADGDPGDDNGHGTQAIGVAAATGNNGTGISGACWSCTVMPVKVTSASGSVLWSTAANGLVWATDHGADVISMSFSGSAGNSTLANAITYAHDRGVVLVGSAGNNGTTSQMYPAAYPAVLSVAGSNQVDSLYSWSSYGSWVDLAAPGCDDATTVGGGYGTFCGTSASAPLVAGVAGLLRAAKPAATNSEVEAALQASAVSIGASVASGRVNAAAALVALGAAAPAPTTTASPALTESPTAAPSPSSAPSPNTSPTASPSSSPTSVAPAPTTTTTYSDALNPKSTSRSYAVPSGSGTLQATLTSTKSASLTLSLLDAAGRALVSQSGSGPLRLQQAVGGGNYTLRVAGDGSRTTITLTVTAPAR